MYIESSHVSNIFSFFTELGSDQIFADHLSYRSQKEQKHNLGLFDSLVKKNPIMSILELWRTFRGAEGVSEVPSGYVPPGANPGTVSSSSRGNKGKTNQLSHSHLGAVETSHVCYALNMHLWTAGGGWRTRREPEENPGTRRTSRCCTDNPLAFRGFKPGTYFPC